MLAQHSEQAEHTEQAAQKAASITVIGMGNDYRADDATGLLVARRLKGIVSHLFDKSQVRVLECAGGSFELMDLWENAEHVVLVDAVSSGAEPGTIFRLDAIKQPIPSSLFHYSTHGLNLADTIELARLLHKLPPRLIVFGVEGLDFGLGQRLSEDIEGIMEYLVEAMLEYIKYNLGPRSHSESQEIKQGIEEKRHA